MKSYSGPSAFFSWWHPCLCVCAIMHKQCHLWRHKTVSEITPKSGKLKAKHYKTRMSEIFASIKYFWHSYNKRLLITIIMTVLQNPSLHSFTYCMEKSLCLFWMIEFKLSFWDWTNHSVKICSIQDDFTATQWICLICINFPLLHSAYDKTICLLKYYLFFIWWKHLLKDDSEKNFHLQVYSPSWLIWAIHLFRWLWITIEGTGIQRFNTIEDGKRIDHLEYLVFFKTAIVLFLTKNPDSNLSTLIAWCSTHE